MHLIDDIDLIFSLCWSEFGVFDDLSYIFDTSIARCIYLYDIDHSLIGKSETVLTFFTRIPIGEDIRTVDRLCKNSGECCLTCSVKSEKDIAMVDRLVFARIHEYFFHKALPHDIVKCMRSVFLIEGLMRYF